LTHTYWAACQDASRKNYRRESETGDKQVAKITYCEHDGVEHVVDVKPGLSVMEGAVKNSIPGIDADCGGASACATCHVYVDGEWTTKTGPKTAMAVSMLELAEGVAENSRLACQIKVTDALDGLVVRMPQSQH